MTCPFKYCIYTMASDRGQNRNLFFVASKHLYVVENSSSCRRVPLFVPSKLLYAVEYCSSSRRVPLFVPSCSSFRRNLVKSSCFSAFVNSLCRRVLHFVVISLCRRSLCRRVLHGVDDGISRSAVTLLFPPILALVIKTRWREK